MRVIRQIARGCGTLPHVGEHPGTAMLFVPVVSGALAGAHAGWIGTVVGAAIMSCVFVPMFLYGAYERAQESDRMTNREG